jgi:hypothetical protein
VSVIERLIELLAAQYRWGLHPLKLLAALLVPVGMIWLADRRLRARTAALASEDDKFERQASARPS